MSLTILNTVLDEEYRTTQTGTADDNDVSQAAFDSSTVDEAVALLSLTTLSGYTGFPQHAVKADFVSSSNPVTDYFLGDSSGDPLDGVATDLSVGSNQVFLYSTDDPNIVVGRVGTGTTADPDGDVALVIAIEETKDSDGFVTTASMWTVLYAPLLEHGEDLVDSADQLDLTDLIYLGSDFDTTTEVPFENFGDVPSGQDAFALVGPTSGSSPVDLLITGFAGSTVGTVNVSVQGLGTNAQHIDEGESLRIDIVDANDANFAKADEASEVHNEANLGYAGGHQDAIAATFEIEQINPTGVVATASVFAYHTDTNVQGAGFNANAIGSPGTAVTIDVEDVVILDAAGNDITGDFLGRGGTIVANGQGVKISGLLAHEQVHFSTDGEEFNRFTVTNSDTSKGPDTFDLGAIKVTVIQGGSDTEFEELGSHLIFQDDGPVMALSGDPAPTLEVDETNYVTDDTGDFSVLFDPPNFGADGEGSVGYTLGIKEPDADSGLVDTATGEAVLLSINGSGQVEGRTATSDDLVFMISVDSDGNVTLDQQRAVTHPNSEDPDELLQLASADLVTLTATAYDSEPADENDSTSATANIGDAFTFKDDGPTIDDSSGENLLVDNTVGSDSAAGDFDHSGGNDPDDNFTIVGAPDSNGFTFSYDDADQDSITGQYNGEDLYTLVVDDEGSYTFTMIGELAPTQDQLNVNEIKAGGPDTNFIDVGTTLTDDFARLSGYDVNGNPAAINESNANVGVKNGNLDNGESIKFELFDENEDPITFLGLNIGTKSAKASDYMVTVDFVDPGVTDITYLQHVAKNGTLEIDPAGDDLIQSITIEKESGPALKLGLGDIEILRPPGDFELSFDLQVTDGDNDHDESSFLVQIDGDGDGLITSPLLA